MKKLGLFSLIAVLAVGAAFAEVSVGGNVVGAWQIMKGVNQENDKGDPAGGAVGDDLKANQPTSNGSPDFGALVRARATVSATNEDGTLGGWMRFQAVPNGGGTLGYVFWKPIDQFKATLGYLWGGANKIGSVVSVEDTIIPVRFWGRGNGWSGFRTLHDYGWEPTNGGSIELNLDVVEEKDLYIVVSVPFDQKFAEGSNAMDVLAQTAARAAFTFKDIGQFALNWDGGTMTKLGKDDDGNDVYDPAYLSAHFNLTAVENLEASIGFELPLAISKYHRAYYGDKDPDDKIPVDYAKPGEIEKDVGKFNRQLPMSVNLRASYSADALFVGGGVYATFGGAEKETKLEEGLTVGLTVNPAYDFGTFKLGLIGEAKMALADKWDGKYAVDKDTGKEINRGMAFSFNAVPYVQKDLAGGSVYAGFQIEGTPYGGYKDDKFDAWKTAIGWSVPVGFVYSF